MLWGTPVFDYIESPVHISILSAKRRSIGANLPIGLFQRSYNR